MQTNSISDRMKEIKKSKTVRFADDNTSVMVFTAEEALCPLWLAVEDYQDQRQRVKDEAEYLKTKGYGSLLKNGLDEGNKLAQKQMNAFSQLPGIEYPRGTEVYLSHQHRDELDRNHSKVTKGVLSRQKALRQKDTAAEIVPEKLRNISRKHSRSSRVFARRLGIADQRAVTEGDDIFEAQAMVKELNQGNAKMVRRKASVQDMGSLGGGKSVGPIFGLAFVASQIAAHKNVAAQKVDRIPSQVLRSTGCSVGSNCANVIQDALDLLDLDDDIEDPFTTPNFQRGVAKTA